MRATFLRIRNGLYSHSHHQFKSALNRACAEFCVGYKTLPHLVDIGPASLLTFFPALPAAYWGPFADKNEYRRIFLLLVQLGTPLDN